MASLRFHRVPSLPASCTQGDVYYVIGEGIYVCITSADSGATESNYQRFSYANSATTTGRGVVSLNDVKAVKVNNAVAADNYAVGGGIDNKFTSIETSINNIGASVNGKKLTITNSDGSMVEFTDTDTHNTHGHTFSANAATSTSDVATEVEVVSALGNAAETDGNLSSTYDRVKVPTLKVTNDLASEIAGLKSINATGMQYKGTAEAVPASGKVGDVYRVTVAIEGVGAEVGDFIVCNTATEVATPSSWDVWQANVNKDAYWDTNVPVDGNFVIAEGATGKIKDSGKNASSFDVAGAAAAVLGNSGDSADTATVYGAIAKADSKWTKAYAQALAAADGSKAGVATFNSSNFSVSNEGHVDLVWATWESNSGGFIPETQGPQLPGGGGAGI